MIMNGIVSYKRMTKEKKAIIWYAICNAFQKGIAFLTIPIITRILNTDEYGIYSVFISWRDILIIFATLNLYCGVFTKLLVDNKDDQDRCTSSLQALSCTCTFVCLFIYLLFPQTINDFLGMSMFEVMLLFAYFFFFPAYSLWSTKKRVNNQYLSMVVVTMIISVLTPVTSIFLLICTEMRQDAVIVGNTIIYILFGFFFFGFNLIKGKTWYEKSYWVYSLKYNIPLIPHYLAMIILGQSDRLMIKKFCGESDAGIYSLAYQISMMMNIVFNAINSSFVPRSYSLLRKRELNTLRKETTQLVFVCLGMTLLAILVAPEFVLIMGGKKYMAALYALPPVCLSVFITFYYSFFSSIEFYFSKTKSVMLASSLSAITNIILNWIFIPKFGFLAAGYTTLASYLFLLVFHYFFSKKVAEQECGEKVYNGKFAATAVGISIASSLLMLSIYKHPILRYSIVLLLIIFAITKKELLIKYLKKN